MPLSFRINASLMTQPAPLSSTIPFYLNWNMNRASAGTLSTSWVKRHVFPCPFSRGSIPQVPPEVTRYCNPRRRLPATNSIPATVCDSRPSKHVHALPCPLLPIASHRTAPPSLIRATHALPTQDRTSGNLPHAVTRPPKHVLGVEHCGFHALFPVRPDAFAWPIGRRGGESWPIRARVPARVCRWD
ncbi:hypothetical protein P154DRAFT_25209 [Amniculicola lignicola CBS 123094]|uniref:Uncharacterized protein n=1 Tax=Amniculicola lignicola CBS 123094 TaxID=1392246 RepID=A0A6A5WTJ4_9PLEO|nr:hypothetical protein P154DRAFT_25209 [Amniculicola lignicola CBS 123094]